MVNRMRHTRAHTANRRSHHALKERNLSMCPKCGAPKLNHAMCTNCGTYKDRAVVDVQAAVIKKQKKQDLRDKAMGLASGTKES
jgi:large subunit ribosomal protein L32